MKLYWKKIRREENKVVKRYYFCGIKFLYKRWSGAGRVTRVFGITISRNYKGINKDAISKNFLDQTILDPLKIKETALNKRIELVIPVYNGYSYLKSLFESIKKNTDIEWRAIVVDDHSSDSRIKIFLDKEKSTLKNKLVLIENDKNLGFVQSVNRALKKCKYDVALINTDVILPPHWASKLFYPIFFDKHVASVTPFSNAATIFSIPKLNENNLFSLNLEGLNSAFSNIKCDFSLIKLCTGVGFCMAISHRTLAKIGYLDKIFGKGYGEENDWCQRAIKAGFYNTIAPNLFVWHQHGGTFQSNEKKKLIDDHLKILSKRYPTYFKQIDENLNNPNFVFTRFWAEIIFMTLSSENSFLWFAHCWGGGAEFFLQKKVKSNLRENINIIVRNVVNTPAYTIEYIYKDYKNKILVDFKQLNILLKTISINRIKINNLAGYSNIYEVFDLIKQIKSDKNSVIDYYLHDYQSICPTINLMSNHRFCNLISGDFDKCRKCLMNNEDILTYCDDITKYRTAYQDLFINSVDNIIGFSEASFNIFKQVFFGLDNKLKLVPHDVISFKSKKNIFKRKKYKVAILGAIMIHKGSLVLKEIDRLIPKYEKLSFFIVGYSDQKFEHIDQSGKYASDDLPDILEKNDIDAIFIPSVWPETFSFTTSEAIGLGYPVISFNLGAQGDRVSKYSKGLVLNLNNFMNTFFEDVYNFINKLAEDNVKGHD